jgi:hypothetical protein
MCARHITIIPPENQRTGCVAHLFIPAFVRGEQVDAGEDWVMYVMANGEKWMDDAQDALDYKK